MTPASKAKENADELVAKKKEIDAQVIAKRNEAKELEAQMHAADKLVMDTEVRAFCGCARNDDDGG